MIHSLLQSAAEQHQLPALSVAASRNGEEVVSFGFGTTEPSGEMPVNVDTQFGVASITKLVTTLQLLLLCEEQHLSLNDPVVKHLPEWRFAARTPIRLHHMLSHACGLPGLDSRFHAKNLNDPADQTAQLHSASDLVQYLNKQAIHPLAAPGQLLNYSNECFCLAGGLIERYRRMPYADATAETVFKPLGMHRSFTGNQDATAAQNIALPLSRANQALKQTAFWDAPLFYPAGGAVSSARDLVKLFAVLGEKQTIIPQNLRQSLLVQRMQVPSRPGCGSTYGLGLEAQHLDADHTLYWHSGQRTGIASFAGYVPQADLGLAVLCNLANAPVKEIAFKVIASLLDRPDITWPPMTHDVSRRSIDRPGYSGSYANDENIALKVVSRNDKLYLRNGSDETLHRLEFCDHCHGSVSGQTFSFLKHHPDDTYPWAIALDLRILPRKR